MAAIQWKSFYKIKGMAQESVSQIVAEKVDATLSALMEAIADTLPTATTDQLREGAVAARDALEAYERLDGYDEFSSSYVAGRLASAVDILGYASYQTADQAVEKLARAQPYASVLAALVDGPMRSVDLAARLEKDKAQISKWLTALRDSGAVTSHKHGRELVSALTPVGRLVVEAGWQDERRAPLKTSNVVDLSAAKYDLGARAAPGDVHAAEVPRISASGA